MTKKFNLFQYIISQIGNNVKNGEENDTIEVSKFNNPTTVINVMVREGCFKVYEISEKDNVYTIKYKDLNLNTNRLKHLLRWDKSIDRLKLNDMLRYEDMRAYTTDALTEYDGAYTGDNIEHLAYTDDCTFDLYAQMKGYTPNELQSYIEAGFISREELQAEYIEFLEQSIAKDWQFKEDEELELV